MRIVTVTGVVFALLAAAVAAGDSALPPLRPGDPLGHPATCTLNFVFADASSSYIGTAAHCVDGAGAVVANEVHGPFGVVDVVLPDVDFALIRVDGDEAVDAAVIGIGGPTGVAADGDTDTGDVLATYGHGLGVGLAMETRVRLGVLVGDSSTEFWWDTVTTPGDSGAPVILLETGLAVGIVSDVGLLGHTSTDVGPHLDHVLQRLAEEGRPVVLQTAPLVEQG